MKLSYEELTDKITELWKTNKDLTTWQNNLTKLIEESGWNREEWNLEVSRQFALDKKENL